VNLVSEEHLILEGRALAHAVSHRLLNADARFIPHGSLCAIFGGQGPVYFMLFDFPPVSYHSISLAYLFICFLVDAQSAD
jgi:hypothetical protein